MFTSVRQIFASRRNALVAAFIFSGCVSVLMLAIPLYTLQVFESVVPTGSIETLAALSTMAVIALVATTVIEVVRDRILLKAGLWLDFNLGKLIAERSLTGVASAAELREEAKLAQVVKAFATGPALAPLFDAPWTPLYLIGLFILHPILGWVGLISAMLLTLAALWQSMGTEGQQLEATKSNELAEKWWQAAIANPMRTLGLGMVRPARARYDALADEHIVAAYDLGNRSSVIKAFARFVRLVSQIAVFGAGAFIVVKGEATGGVLIASSIIMGKALAPIEQAVSMLKIVSAAFAAGRRLRSLPALVHPAGVDHAAEDGELPGRGQIVLNDVAFHYPGRQTFAIRGIEIEIAPGQSIGIIGPNGSGKSALAGVIAGALDPKIGQATLDGVPMTRWQRTAEQPPIGYLGPDPHLLEGTVHDNICGFDEASALTVARAAIKAGVHELISGLPEGYETKISLDGQTLSQRERRAVALARAVYGKRRMVVLDEPELGLDAQGERRLIRHLSELKKEGVRLVIATQQPRLLALVDKVAVLRKGAIEMFAPTEEVAKRLSGSAHETSATARKPKAAPRAATGAPRPEVLQ